MICAVASGHAAAFFTATQTLTVVEYRNRFLEHYFLTADPEEMKAIDAGAAGPGWERTGYAFNAYGAPGNWPPPNGDCPSCLPAFRFYAAGANSHFFTLDREEAALLDRPGTGWMVEKVAFYAYAPNAGGCSFGHTPLYRLYNNRWMFDDSNHRYVTSERERERMRAAGWVDEGVRFCVLRALASPLKVFDLDLRAEDATLSGAQCADDSRGAGACIAAANLAPPTAPFSITEESARLEVLRLTGLYGGALVYASADSPSEALRRSFSTAYGLPLGLHLDSVDRMGPGPVTLGPLRRLDTAAPLGDADRRFFPFRDLAPASELSLRYTLRVARVATRQADASALGQAAIDFVDVRSWGRIRLAILAFGIEQGDSVTLEPGAGRVEVRTTMRQATPFGRGLGGVLPALPGFTGVMDGGGDFRLGRDEFARVLADARALLPALSDDPADYLVANFRFENRLEGDAEVGMSVSSLALRLLPVGLP